jgi:hypothetical protein
MNRCDALVFCSARQVLFLSPQICMQEFIATLQDETQANAVLPTGGEY